MRLLLVEDDQMLAAGIKQGLATAGYVVDIVESAENAIDAMTSDGFDAAIIDIGLPQMNGMELTQRMRQRGQTMPVLMLTARDALQDRVQGLDAGADDYISKPFSTKELLARVRAILRRKTPEAADTTITLGDLSLDPATYRVQYADRPIHLGPTEFKLLHYLMKHAERVHSRTQLLDRVWSDHVSIEERTVDVHIKRLRESMNDAAHMIETVRGAGYRITAIKR